MYKRPRFCTQTMAAGTDSSTSGLWDVHIFSSCLLACMNVPVRYVATMLVASFVR